MCVLRGGRGVAHPGVQHRACALPSKLILLPPFTCSPGIPGGPGGPGTPGGPCGREEVISPGRKLCPVAGGSSVRAGKLRGAGGQEEKQRRQATHTCGPGCQELPIQSPGAPWVGVGVAKGERLQATSTPSAGLRAEAAGWGAKPCGAFACWAVAGSQASPPGRGEGAQHHLPACRRRPSLLGGDRSTPQAGPEKTRAFVRGGARREDLLETDSWGVAQAHGMERPGLTSRTCLL